MQYMSRDTETNKEQIGLKIRTKSALNFSTARPLSVSSGASQFKSKSMNSVKPPDFVFLRPLATGSGTIDSTADYTRNIVCSDETNL